MANQLSQAGKILKWLQSGNSLTQKDATEQFDCSRLAARIKDLRNEGHNIISTPFVYENYAGITKTIAKYHIEIIKTQGELL